MNATIRLDWASGSVNERPHFTIQFTTRAERSRYRPGGETGGPKNPCGQNGRQTPTVPSGERRELEKPISLVARRAVSRRPPESTANRALTKGATTMTLQEYSTRRAVLSPTTTIVCRRCGVLGALGCRHVIEDFVAAPIAVPIRRAGHRRQGAISIAINSRTGLPIRQRW